MKESPNKLSQFWQELRKRKVIPIFIAYLATSYAIIEFLDITSNRFSIPDSTFTLLYILAAIGLPLAFILPWYINRKKQESTPDISSLESERSPVQEKSIIVLPFENISPDPDQEYFSDGLTEEIITDLSHIHDLLVISRSSAMTFKGTKKKIREIASDVNVRYVLEGSVRKARNNLRITAQLIDANSDSHIWAEKYNGTLDDIFNIQAKVSQSIVDALKLKLSPKEDRKLSERPIDNVPANDCYLRAKYEIMRFTEDGVTRALSFLQNGLDLIGENPLIYSGMGLAHFQYVNLGIKHEEHLEKAAEYARKTLELNPESAEAHFTLGCIYMLEGNSIKSIDHLKIAHSANPTDPDILMWYAWLLSFAGKTSIASTLAEQTLKYDPLNPNTYMIIGAVAWIEGRFGLAEENCYKAYKMRPDMPLIQFWYALSLAYNKKYEKAISLIDISLKSPVQDISSQVSHFLKLTLQQDIDGIKSLLSKDFITITRRDSQFSYHIATFYSLLDQADSAINWLKNAVDRGIFNFTLMNKIDPFLENIRGEKRFKKLMERVKKEWENFEV